MSLDVGKKYSVQGGAQLSNKVMESWVKQRNFIEAILLTKVTENVHSLGLLVLTLKSPLRWIGAFGWASLSSSNVAQRFESSSTKRTSLPAVGR